MGNITNPRYQRMRRRQFWAWTHRLITSAIIVLVLLAAMAYIEFRALEIAADRPCQTASPQYAIQLGCNQR